MYDDRFDRAGTAGSLGTPTHYNGILFGDMTAVQADCEGALAVGGTARFGSTGQGYDVGAGAVSEWASILIGNYENPHHYPTLLLGGAVSDKSTAARVYAGDVVLKSSYRQAYERQTFKFEADAVDDAEDDAVDAFFDAVKMLTEQTGDALLHGNTNKIQLADLSILKSLNHSEYVGDNLCTQKRILVYTIDAGKDDAIRISDIALGSYIGNYDAIIINATAKKITFTSGAILYDGTVIDTSLPRIYPGNALIGLVASKLIFNFPNATTVSLSHYGLIGSMLAPNAAVTADGGSLNGMLIADSLYQTGGMELHGFPISQGEDLWTLGCPPPTGSVMIQKTDEGSHGLAGAQFTLYAYDETTKESKPVASGQSDANGQLTFDSLPMGSYKLMETQAPQRYVLPVTHEWIFELTESDEGEAESLDILYIKNTLAKGGVTLYKLDYDDREIKLANAEFSLYSYNEETGAYDVLVAENLTTNDQGVLTINDLLLGKYKLVETQAPQGYYLSKNGAAEFEIKLDKDGRTVIEEDLELLNQKLASLELVKRDADDTETTLPGAVFTLYQRNPESGAYEAISSGWTTDENGTLTIPDLAPGQYRLIETAAPAGYYLPADAQTDFVVEADDDDRILPVAPISIANKLLGKIQFYKIDSENESLYLAGAEFALYKKDSEGTYVVYRTGLVTGADGGLLIEGLEPGDYKLVEVKAPSGYLLPEDPEVTFTIKL